MLILTQIVMDLPAIQETQVWSLGQKDPLEKEMATHSNIFAWKTPWTEEPGGLHPKAHKELDMTKHAGRMRGKKLPDQLADLKK